MRLLTLFWSLLVIAAACILANFSSWSNEQIYIDGFVKPGYETLKATFK